jgi:2-oxoglutarate ferredoxin oxidoreductase subunit beta
MATAVVELKPKDYKSNVPPDWCPGCGDFAVLNALQRACAELKIPPHQIVVVSGIGCSSNLPGFFRSYGVHGLHGRPIPVATGIKLANKDLTVIATGGDGDGYGIGLSHFIHAIRRNVDITYIVMNNQVYGLTTGQVSPTSLPGMPTKSTPTGNVEEPINPLTLALAAGCDYVARGFSGDAKHLTELYKGAILHKGFALVDVFSPCVTFNRLNTYDWFRQRIFKLEDEGHDPTDFVAAVQMARLMGDRIPIGVFYRNPNPRPPLHEADPVLRGPALVKRPLGISQQEGRRLLEENM